MERQAVREANGEAGTVAVGAEGTEGVEAPIGDARDDPIVALEPDELKQGSHFTGVRHERSTIGAKQPSLGQSAHEDIEEPEIDPASLPSLYMQEKLYLYQ